MKTRFSLITPFVQSRAALIVTVITLALPMLSKSVIADSTLQSDVLISESSNSPIQGGHVTQALIVEPLKGNSVSRSPSSFKRLISKRLITYVLQFDVNGTILAKGDRSSKLNLAQCGKAALARSSKFNAKWTPTQKSKSSFAHHVLEAHPGIQGKSVRLHLIDQFPSLYENAMCFSERPNHFNQLKQEIRQDEKLIQAALASQPTLLLDSFVEFLSYLKTKNISHHIVLRSFGEDLRDAASAVKQFTNQPFEFASFKDGQLILANGQKLDSPQAIQKYINSVPYLAIRDDWQTWNAHDHNHLFGKPFYADIKQNKDERSVPLFFDDNIGPPDSKTSIVSLKSTEGQPTADKRTELFGKRLVAVDTCAAILDPKYYVSHFEKTQTQLEQ